MSFLASTLRAAGVVALLAGLHRPVAAAPPTTHRKVIIDQDAFGPGGSNLQAILMLLQAPDVDVLGITVVSGDGWRDENVDHTLRLLEIAGRTDVPVYAGAVMPLVNSDARTTAWEQRYGKLFYKGVWTKVWPEEGTVRRAPYHADPNVVPPSPAGLARTKPAEGGAVDFLVRSVHRYPGEVTIWAGGPLTDLALAARIDPAFASLAKELVFMGGSFNPKPSDNAFAGEYVHAPRLEFNMRFDPEAASAVLHEPWKRIVQLPVDPTTKTFFKPAFFERIKAGDTPFGVYLAAYGQSFPMWDELAAAVWLDPSIVTRSQQMLVDIDTDSSGAGYGNTLSWRMGAGPGMGERAVTVVQDIDLPRFEALTLDLLSRRKPAP